jgi:TolA-binding protein
VAGPSFESARDELYGLDPEDFMRRRAELAKAARDAGAADVAKRIGGLRKPNRAAYVVNALVRAEPDVGDELAGLAERLREAQGSLDGASMRELSAERTKLVDRLARAAFRAASVSSPPAALRDDVVGTLTAAVADAEILARVREGALVRPESWSGFGAVLSPSLSVVPAAGPAKATRGESAAEPAAARRARERSEARLADAERELAEAQQELETAKTSVAELERLVRQTEAQLKDVHRRLDDARLDERRARVRADKAEKARAALDARST